jgi:hypothetical protein
MLLPSVQILVPHPSNPNYVTPLAGLAEITLSSAQMGPTLDNSSSLYSTIEVTACARHLVSTLSLADHMNYRRWQLVIGNLRPSERRGVGQVAQPLSSTCRNTFVTELELTELEHALLPALAPLSHYH